MSSASSWSRVEASATTSGAVARRRRVASGAGTRPWRRDVRASAQAELEQLGRVGERRGRPSPSARPASSSREHRRRRRAARSAPSRAPPTRRGSGSSASARSSGTVGAERTRPAPPPGRTRPRAAPAPRARPPPPPDPASDLDLAPAGTGRRRASAAPAAAPPRRSRAPIRPSGSSADSTIRATVPTSNRTSPPPTSEPRSMSTTPNRPSPARQSSTSARYRGSNTWSGRSWNGTSALPSGNIGSSQRRAPSRRVAHQFDRDRYASARRPSASRGVRVGGVGQQRVEHRGRLVERADRREHLGGLGRAPRPGAPGTRAAAARPTARRPRGARRRSAGGWRACAGGSDASAWARGTRRGTRRRDPASAAKSARAPSTSRAAPAWNGSKKHVRGRRRRRRGSDPASRRRAARRRSGGRPRSSGRSA